MVRRAADRHFNVMQFTCVVEGNVEKWKKWRCSDSSGESFNPCWLINNLLTTIY